MTKCWSWPLCVLFAMIASSPSTWAQDAKIIVYDGWWAIDYAEGMCERTLAWHKEKKGLIAQLGCDSIPSCKEMMPMVTACTLSGPAQGARQFENKIVSEFLANTSCKGIAMAGFQGPQEAVNMSVAEAMQKPHWAFSANLVPGNEKQYWQVRHSTSGVYADGTDSPSEIVQKLCTLVRGQGGAVLK